MLMIRRYRIDIHNAMRRLAAAGLIPLPFPTLASESKFSTLGGIRNLPGGGLTVFDIQTMTVDTITRMRPDHWTQKCLVGH